MDYVVQCRIWFWQYGEIVTDLHKINLANHERGTFSAGNHLPVFKVNTPEGIVGGSTLPDESFPARSGAQIILQLLVIASILDLLAAAAETQRSSKKALSYCSHPEKGALLGVDCFIWIDDSGAVSNWYLDPAIRT